MLFKLSHFFLSLPGGPAQAWTKPGRPNPPKLGPNSPNIACNMGSWRRSNRISMKGGRPLGRSPLPVFYHTFCTLGAFRLRETSYRELKPCKLQWFLHLRVHSTKKSYRQKGARHVGRQNGHETGPRESPEGAVYLKMHSFSRQSHS